MPSALSPPRCFVPKKVSCLNGTAAYDYYRALVSRLLKGGESAVGLQEPSIPDVQELIGEVEQEADLDA